MHQKRNLPDRISELWKNLPVIAVAGIDIAEDFHVFDRNDIQRWIDVEEDVESNAL